MIEANDVNITQLINTIKSYLVPNLLKSEYREQNKSNPMYGHCYVATEALYHLLGEYRLNETFKPFQAKDENNISHWWLQNDVNEIIDITSDQYTSVGRLPPYINGRPRQFMFPSPSKRSRNVIESVKTILVGFEALTG